jgi:hypothetical protein
LDYSSEERERVLELLATPKDKGTLDELGVGTVRDAIADHLYPGWAAGSTWPNGSTNSQSTFRPPCLPGDNVG